MANFLDKMLNMVGWSEPEEEVTEDLFESPVKSSEKKQTTGKVVSMGRSAVSTMNILYPESFDEARDICECIRANQAVIVNLENIKRDLAQRIVDFISGSVYSLDGGIKKISAGIFVVTPNSFVVEENKTGADVKQEIEDRSVLPWTN